MRCPPVQTPHEARPPRRPGDAAPAAAAASAHAAREHRTFARPRSRSCAGSGRTTTPRVTSRQMTRRRHPPHLQPPRRNDLGTPRLRRPRSGDADDAARAACGDPGRAPAGDGRLRARDVAVLAAQAGRGRGGAGRRGRDRRPAAAAVHDPRRTRRRPGRSSAVRRVCVQPSRDLDGPVHDLRHLRKLKRWCRGAIGG
jgi:hypothetical protein